MGYSSEQRQVMLEIVSRSLREGIIGEQYMPQVPDLAGLDTLSGCFVTLKTSGRLRGCIGCFVSEKPLYKTLAVYARASLLEDPRFVGNRITLQELSEVYIDISVLSPLQSCADPERIRLGVDGIYIMSTRGSGCFLPQVATETGWDVEQFWGNCCMQKAGIAYDAWKEDGVELYTFEAEVIEGRYVEHTQ